MRFFYQLIAFALGGLFLYSGAVKASTSDEFAMNIAQYLILPPPWWKPAAIAISLAELCTGILLLIPHTCRWGAALLLLLMAVFLSALTTALYHGLIIECGCLQRHEGGTTAALWFAVWRDVAISLAATVLLLAPRKPKPTSGHEPNGNKNRRR